MKKLILKIFFSLISLSLLAALGMAGVQKAEAQANLIQTKNFIVEFSPTHPGPNTKVSAQVISYTFDVNRAAISWILNGKLAGTEKTFSFTTADLGSQINLQVSVITPNNETLSQNFTFQSAETTLLWETSGYAPASYRGKILPVSQSLIKVVAFPRGFQVSSSELIYEWKRNGKNIPDSSGRGKRTFTFYSNKAGEDAVEVAVSTSDESIIAENTNHIKIREPQILFYEEVPWEGPQYQKELGNVLSLQTSELALRAEPFFFSKRALTALSYEWQMNNKKIETPKKPNLLNLAIPPETKNGTSLIELSLQNSLNLLEMANKELQINFNLNEQ